MLVRYWQTALIAAIMALTGNAVWAQTCLRLDCCAKAKCKDAKNCCAAGDCCKDGKCCKDADCCKNSKCGKDNKCECATGGDCCCKKGECNCKKTSCCKGACCISCPVSGANTKGTTIIVVMPPALPTCGVYNSEQAEMMTHAPMPVPPGMMLPHPLPMLPPGLMPPHMASLQPLPPPQYACPMSSAPCAASPCPFVGCLSSLLSMVGDLCCHVRPLNVPSLCAPAMGLCAPAYVQMAQPFPLPRELATQEACSAFPPQPAVNCIYAGTPVPMGEPCAPPTPIADAKLRINAKPSGNELEMSFDDGTRIRCKKMTVTIADKEITLSRFDDRVRVRGEELKATADCVRGDRKDRLILDGGVVLHYKKDGHSAHVNGDHIEVNLATGAVKIESGEALPAPSGTAPKSLDTDD